MKLQRLVPTIPCAALAAFCVLAAHAEADVYCDLAVEAVVLLPGSEPGLYHVDVDIAIGPGPQPPLESILVRCFEGDVPIGELSLNPQGIPGGSCCSSASQCPALDGFSAECRDVCTGTGGAYRCEYVLRQRLTDLALLPGSLLSVVVDPDGQHAELCDEGTANNALAVVVPEQPQAICVGKTNSAGCVASVNYSGWPSLSAEQPFRIGATHVLFQQPGILFYGSEPASTPFQGGTLCASSPIVRTPVQLSGGDPDDPCSGAFDLDFSAWTAGGADPSLVPGRRVVAQYWYRDPWDPAGFGTSLSNALDFTLTP